MNAYIYDADIYCEACGEAIRERVKAEGMAPSHPGCEWSYDSAEYPKGPYPDGGGESDCPQHCGSHADCLNALTFEDGLKVGAFLENPLTSDGEQYVRDEHRDNRSEVTQLWIDHYGIEPHPIATGLDWDSIRSELDDMEWEDTEDDTSMQERRVFIGTVFGLLPSGKYYAPYAHSNVTEAEANQDEEWYEAAEAEADERGLFITSGDGDPCDLFVVESRDKPDEDCPNEESSE